MTSEIEIQWPAPPKKPQLGEREVHVWAIGLDQSPARVAAFAAPLSVDEQARAARFRFENDQKRFAVGRGWLRMVLAQYLRVAPATLAFEYGARGKPGLSRADGAGELRFNLAHSGGLALLAVTHLGSVGVDVECVRAVNDVQAIADRFFSKRESRGLDALPMSEKPAAFFNLWTRKEAWLKATGEGIGDSLSQVEVTFLRQEPARVLSLFGDSEAAAQWTLQELAPANGFVGALALRARDVQVCCWKWPLTSG